MKESPEEINEMQSHLSEFNMTDVLIHNLIERVKELEDKVDKKKNRPVTTRSQQMLLLKHCGLLEVIQNLGIKQVKQKAKFLAILLNADATNIESDFAHIFRDSPELRNAKDYEFLIRTFEETGLDAQKTEAQAILNKIPLKK